MSGRKAKSVENNENLCPLTRKRMKSAISTGKQIKDLDTPQSLEEMGVGMLESDESSSSASAIALAVSASDENSNEVTPNLDAPKFCNHTMQQSRRNYNVDLDTTDNATFSNETLTSHNFTNAASNFNNNLNNNSNSCSSTEKSTDQHGSTEKVHQRKVAILGAGNLSSKKSRSPLSTVVCNSNYKNITKSYMQATSTPSSYVPTAQEFTPCAVSSTTSEPVTASTSTSVTRKFFTPDENFFLYRNRALRGSDGKDHFSELSDEIVLQIFKLLPKKALIRCSYVCQRFNRCARDESLWSRLDLGGRSLRAGALGDILPRGVVILRLAQSELHHPTFDPELLQMYPDFESKLQFLDLSMAVISKASLKLLLSRCRQLKKLSLEHIQVNDEICDEIARNLELEALNLAMVTGLEAWSVRKMMTELKNLNSLNISWTNLHVDAVSALVTNVTPNLMRLNISGCRKTMFDSHLVTLSKRCPQLLELDVSDCTALSSNAVSCVCKFKSLEYLSLSRCYQILAPAYMELSNIPTLKFLDVFGILSDTALEMLEQSFPKIGINKFIHSSVARPTVGTRRTSIWGLRTRD